MSKKTWISILVMIVPLLAFATHENSWFSPLKNEDSLGQVVENIKTLWADGNISTGTTSIYARALKIDPPQRASEWIKLSQDLFAADFKYFTDDDLPKVRLNTTAKRFNESDVEDLTKAVALGNAYDTSNPENFLEIRKQAWVALRKLEVGKETQTLITKARIHSDATDSMKDVYSFAFINKKTKKAVLVFIIEGTM